MNVAHRDVKADNVLVKTTAHGTTLKLCDFACSKKLEAPIHGSYMSTLVMTLDREKGYSWMAPEIAGHFNEDSEGRPIQFKLSDNGYTRSADIFSLGLVLYFIATKGKALFSTLNETKRHGSLYSESRATLDSSRAFQLIRDDIKHPLMRDLISNMVHPAPAQRINFEKARLHPYLWSFDKMTGFLTDIDKAGDPVVQVIRRKVNAQGAKIFAATTGKWYQPGSAPPTADFEYHYSTYCAMPKAVQNTELDFQTATSLIHFFRNWLAHPPELLNVRKRAFQLSLVKHKEAFLYKMSVAFPKLIPELFYIAMEEGYEPVLD